MTTTAILLVILSAFSHATWKILGKKRNPSVAFFTFTLLSSSLCFSPAIYLYWDVLRTMPTKFWELLCASSISQTLYFIGLAGAYRRGDISLSYPLARALPVLLVCIHGIIQVGFHIVSPIAVLGMGLIVTGCLMTPMKDWSDITIGNYLNLRTLFIAIAGISGACYSVVDFEALKILRDEPTGTLSEFTPAILYIALQSLGAFVLMFYATCCSAATKKRFYLISKIDIGYALFSGLIISGTYLLVLASMAYASHVSFIVALRQLSIPIAALFGIVFLKEDCTFPKLLGVFMLFVGAVILIAGS